MSGRVAGLEAALDRQRLALDARLERIAALDVPADAGVLAAPIRYAIAGGGKRLRGALCVVACEALGGGSGSGIYDVASAIELVHTYSLVHDDLPCMDDDDLRRGRPTLHRVFGSVPATLAGTALLDLAVRVLIRGGLDLGLGREGACQLVSCLARGIGGGGMVGGQWLDLDAEGGVPELDELASIHARKTGALFEAALAMGALAARAAPVQVAACAAFGADLGLAFQVVDDVLDETGDPTELGKTPGKDRRQRKATYPALLGIDGAREGAKAALDRGIARLREAGIASAELEAAGTWVLARAH